MDTSTGSLDCPGNPDCPGNCPGRRLGLSLALVSRLLLLFGIVWIMRLTAPLFTILGNAISARDLILIGGGLFLLAKSTLEIHDSLEIPEHDSHKDIKAVSFTSVLLQIAIIDMVFSLDSVITAVGLVEYVSIMVIAIVIAVGVMLMSAATIGNFVDDNPTIKMLALSFLILIGMTLVGEGLDAHIPRGYVYFAMAFSIGVEMLNIRVRKSRISKTMHLSKKIQE
jgi:predicted tellurium resistance membrane protein TerC